MAELLKHVEPGERVTAFNWNLLVDAVNQLLQAGQTTGIRIDVMSPAGTTTEPILINSLLQITGQSFGFSLGQSSVVFQGPSGNVIVSVDKMLIGSSDNLLLFMVPSIPGVSEAGSVMTLRVDNGVAHDTRSVFVMPVAVQLDGLMSVRFRSDVPNPNPNPLEAKKSATFALQLETDTNKPATFKLTVDIQDVAVPIPPNLVNSILFLDESGTVNLGKSVNLGVKETRNILVRIPEVPANFANQSFTLRVSAISGDVQAPWPGKFTVGTRVSELDPDIIVKLAETSPPDSNFDGATIKLKPNRQMILIYLVTLKGEQGDFDITIEPKDGTTGWSVKLLDTVSPISGPKTDEQVQLSFTPSDNATPRGAVVFRIKRGGAAIDWFQEFTVLLQQ